jgi:hypothetical protein
VDEAFLFERSIDIETYDRHAEKLREELTLARIDRHSGQLEELDVEGILAFAERVLPRAADLWVQASLEQRQRFQQLFFPDGIAFDGNGFVRTAVTAPAFSYLRRIETENEGLVALITASWNRIASWLEQMDLLRSAREESVTGVLGFHIKASKPSAVASSIGSATSSLEDVAIRSMR